MRGGAEEGRLILIKIRYAWVKSVIARKPAAAQTRFWVRETKGDWGGFVENG